MVLRTQRCKDGGGVIEHEDAEGDVMQALQRRSQPFVVAGEAPEPLHPAERPLDHPATRQEDEPHPRSVEFATRSNDDAFLCRIEPLARVERAYLYGRISLQRAANAD